MKELKRILEKILNYIKKIFSIKIIKLYPEGRCKGNVLISYVIAPFLLKKNQKIPVSHSNWWECKQIVEIFLKLGYAVDIINYKNKDFIPKKKYKVFIDIYNNLERISPYLNEDCKKVFHITGAHWLFQNHAEYERLLMLQNRKKITLIPRRINYEPSLGIENADFATILGNDFTLNTFKYANKTIYRIPISSTMVFDFPRYKDFNNCKKNYIWIGGFGLVHKGLDLVLEAFSEMKDYNLTICGLIKEEKDFESAFFKELYETENIKTIGWVDIDSNVFLDVINNNIGVIYPSCSEGGGGSVITCLNAGLIPIVSYESSIDVENFGYILKEISINEIKRIVKKVSSLSAETLKNMSKKAWQYARLNHSKEKFTSEYKKFINGVLNL